MQHNRSINGLDWKQRDRTFENILKCSHFHKNAIQALAQEQNEKKDNQK